MSPKTPTAENSFKLSCISLLLPESPFCGLRRKILGKVEGVAGLERCSWDLLLPLWIEFHPKLFGFPQRLLSEMLTASKHEESTWQSKPTGIPWEKPQLYTLWRGHCCARGNICIPSLPEASDGVYIALDMQVWGYLSTKQVFHVAVLGPTCRESL